ncbi:hypothetical protein BH11PLA1_BH11PLA1_01270 [soil metagenome]
MSAAAPTSPGAMSRGVLRVILIGKAPMEASLRRDPRIELIRARTAIDAIGELNDPIDAHSPVQAVVVVAERGAAALAGATARALGDALREVNPRVRMVRAVEAGERGAAAESEGYDGVLGAGASAEELLDLLMPREGAPGRMWAGRGAGASGASGAPVRGVGRGATLREMEAGVAQAPGGADAPVRGSGHGAAGDAAVAMFLTADLALAGAVAEGREVEGTALLALRTILGDEVYFSRATGGAGEIVTHQGLTFGRLSAAKSDAATLRLAARWLAAWLTLHQQQGELRRQTVTDDLTGAYNRRFFERYVVQAIEKGRATRAGFSVLLLDVDNFKYYNDQYGHSAGDAILSEVVKLLLSTVRTHDRVCRIGGDEIAVVLYDPQGPRDPLSKPLDTAWQITRRFQERVYDHRFARLGDAPGRLTISGGLSTFPWDGLTPTQLLQSADERLMEAKRQGKDRVVLGRDEKNG